MYFRYSKHYFKQKHHLLYQKDTPSDATDSKKQIKKTVIFYLK